MRRRATDLFIAAFLACQILLPLRGLVLDKLDSRGNFSWNMYSRRYSCEVEYTRVDRAGRRAAVSHRAYFRRSSRAHSVNNRERLPAFHRYLCDELGVDGEFTHLLGSVECRINEGPPEVLVAAGVDVCSAENYGVLRR